MPVHEYLTKDQVQKVLFHTSNPTEKMLVQLGLVLGCRVSEIVSIRLSDIGYCKVQIWDEKKDKHRLVVWDPETDIQLRAYMKNDLLPEPHTRKDHRRLFPICGRTVNNYLKGIFTRAGISLSLAHWHILRHTYVVQSLERGVPINHIVAQTGDSPVTILRVYGMPSIESRQEMIDKKAYWR